jgi:hypothetical protein
MTQRKENPQDDLEEMKAAFPNLPMRLKQRWWEWTYYGKHPATNELMWTIEAINPDLAVHLAQGDAERTAMGGRKISDQTKAQRRAEETKMLFAAMCADDEDIRADMVKVVVAWRQGNLVPRWEVPALRALCKDFEPPDRYCE